MWCVIHYHHLCGDSRCLTGTFACRINIVDLQGQLRSETMHINNQQHNDSDLHEVGYIFLLNYSSPHQLRHMYSISDWIYQLGIKVMQSYYSTLIVATNASPMILQIQSVHPIQLDKIFTTWIHIAKVYLQQFLFENTEVLVTYHW